MAVGKMEVSSAPAVEETSKEPPDKLAEESATVKVTKTELQPPNINDENTVLLAPSPLSGEEIPIHLQYAKFPKPIWPKSPVTIPSSFFRDLNRRVQNFGIFQKLIFIDFFEFFSLFN